MKAILAVVARDSVAAAVDATRSLRLRSAGVVKICPGLQPIAGCAPFQFPQRGIARIAEARREVFGKHAQLLAIAAIHRVVGGCSLRSGGVPASRVEVISRSGAAQITDRRRAATRRVTPAR